MQISEKLNEILEKKNLEKYVFDDNPLISYFATAFAGHDLLYKLIQLGSLKQKINVIAHGSSKHIKIMLSDYNPIVKTRAIKRAVDLERNIYHEYVTAEKLELLFSPYITAVQLDFFERETNPFVQKIYSDSKRRDDLFEVMTDGKLLGDVVATIELTDDEIMEEADMGFEDSEAVEAAMQEQVEQSKEFLSKYNFTYEVTHSDQMGFIIISRGGKNIFNIPVNYSYYNETNPLTLIRIRDVILKTIEDALDVYNTSLDQCDFSSVESFQEYKERRLIAKELGFSKEELSAILKENEYI